MQSYGTQFWGHFHDDEWLDDCMRSNMAAVADLDMRRDDGEGTNGDILAQLDVVGDCSRGVDLSTMAHRALPRYVRKTGRSASLPAVFAPLRQTVR